MLGTEPGKLYLRSHEFLKEKNIEILFGKKVSLKIIKLYVDT